MTFIIMLAWFFIVAGLSLLVYRTQSSYLGAVILLPWYAVIVVLSLTGVFADLNSLFSPLALAMTIPTVIGLLLFRTAWLRDLIRRLPLDWLVRIQLYRVFGVAFLIGWLNGDLPLELGLTTGLYDIAIGVAALFVANRLSNHRLVIAWNVLGLLDFAYAISLTLLAGPLGVLSLTPGTEAIGQQPLAFISVFAVPVSILLHSAVLLRVAEQRQPQTQPA